MSLCKYCGNYFYVRRRTNLKKEQWQECYCDIGCYIQSDEFLNDCQIIKNICKDLSPFQIHQFYSLIEKSDLSEYLKKEIIYQQK
jgi:hypothetical protein